jgi:hypothetical protein
VSTETEARNLKSGDHYRAWSGRACVKLRSE